MLALKDITQTFASYLPYICGFFTKLDERTILLILFCQIIPDFLNGS